MYEYHGGKIYIGNEVILPGSELPENAVVTDAAADAEGAAVAEISPGLAHDYRNVVGEKPDLLGHVEMVYSLDETYATHLEQIVRVGAASGKTRRSFRQRVNHLTFTAHPV